MIMIVIMIVIMIMIVIVIVIMIMSIHDYGYGYGYDYDYDKVNDKVKAIRIVIIVITFFVYYFMHSSIANKGPITRVDQAGPVCRDQIQPGFTWSEPSPDDARACFGAVLLLARLARLARWTRLHGKKLSPVNRERASPDSCNQSLRGIIKLYEILCLTKVYY